LHQFLAPGKGLVFVKRHGTDSIRRILDRAQLVRIGAVPL
jgi:hypothetical protein